MSFFLQLYQSWQNIFYDDYNDGILHYTAFSVTIFRSLIFTDISFLNKIDRIAVSCVQTPAGPPIHVQCP